MVENDLLWIIRHSFQFLWLFKYFQELEGQTPDIITRDVPIALITQEIPRVLRTVSQIIDKAKYVWEIYLNDQFYISYKSPPTPKEDLNNPDSLSTWPQCLVQRKTRINRADGIIAIIKQQILISHLTLKTLPLGHLLKKQQQLWEKKRSFDWIWYVKLDNCNCPVY